eukprot:scaffold199535_cov26-Tisochrysis_lutea.AAC.1
MSRRGRCGGRCALDVVRLLRAAALAPRPAALRLGRAHTRGEARGGGGRRRAARATEGKRGGAILSSTLRVGVL